MIHRQYDIPKEQTVVSISLFLAIFFKQQKSFSDMNLVENDPKAGSYGWLRVY